MSYYGETCALASAVVWAVAVILFKRSGEQLAPIALNVFKCAVALVLFAVTLGAHELPLQLTGAADWLPSGLRPAQSWLPANAPWSDYAWLALSGIMGLALADSAFFAALNRCGVGLLAVVDCSYTPLTILFAWALWSEALSGTQWFGVGLILFGVLLASSHAPPQGRSRRELLVGVGLGVTAMALMTSSIVMVKPILARWEVIPAVCVRMLAGLAALLLIVLASRDRTAMHALLRPTRAWVPMLSASILGTYFSLIFWVAGFKHTRQAAVAAVLNQTTVLFQLLLATLVLREPLTRRKLAALALAATGVVVVNLGPGWWRALTAGGEARTGAD